MMEVSIFDNIIGTGLYVNIYTMFRLCLCVMYDWPKFLAILLHDGMFYFTS
jgi:hypothetical protein